MSLAYMALFMIPIEEFPLGIFTSLHDRKSLHFFQWCSQLYNFSILNDYLGQKAISYQVIYSLCPCNVNPLIPVLEPFRISLIKRDNFVISQEHLQFFNHSSFELFCRHFSDLLFWVSLFHGILTELLHVLMFAFGKELLKLN